MLRPSFRMHRISTFVLLVALEPALALDPPPSFLLQWGSPGSMDGQFLNAACVGVDPTGRVYAGDAGNYRIQEFTTDGNFVAKWGSQGNGPGQFSSPRGIALDGSFVYVADQANHRIAKFTSEGTFVTMWGSEGAGLGQFEFPSGIAVTPGGRLYVADQLNHRIQEFTTSGTFVRTWGTSGLGDGQFRYPGGVAVDGAGNVYVAEVVNYRIQKFTADGTFIRKWGAQGSGVGQFLAPGGLAVDASGALYVSETRDLLMNPSNNRIQKFTGDGEPLSLWGSTGEAPGQFDWPYGVAVDGLGNVYVADTYNSRIQKFGVPTSSTIPANFGFALRRIAPNPARGAMLLECAFERPGPARLEILDVSGRHVRTLLGEVVQSANRTLEWDGRGENARVLGSAVYFARLTWNGQTQTRRVVLIR